MAATTKACRTNEARQLTAVVISPPSRGPAAAPMPPRDRKERRVGEEGVQRDGHVTGVQTCALPIFHRHGGRSTHCTTSRIHHEFGSYPCNRSTGMGSLYKHSLANHRKERRTDTRSDDTLCG